MNSDEMGDPENAKAKAFHDDYQRGRAAYDRGDYEAALSIYRGLAERHPTRSDLLLHISAMYQQGLGTVPDQDEAERWTRQAAELGSPVAQFYLSGLYFRQGREQDGTRWLEQAAEREYGPALYHLGRLYETGMAVPVDRSKALEYFRRAARQGHVIAERQISVSLMRGERGLFAIPIGVFRFLRAFWKTWSIVSKDPKSERVR